MRIISLFLNFINQSSLNATQRFDRIPQVNIFAHEKNSWIFSFNNPDNEMDLS